MTTFALIAEAGPLEHQALLLVESIRMFAGRYASAPIIVVSPRAGRRPSPATQRALNAAGATYLEFDIESAVPEYGTSYRVHASARIEGMCAGSLVFLDSDIVFAREPDLELAEGFSAAARPVDVQGMCTTGPDDVNDAYWRALCKTCGVDYDAIPMLTTTVDRARVKASYNGGFLVVRAADAILRRTEDLFIRSVAAGLMSQNIGTEVLAAHGLVTGRGARFWGSSQACFSLAAWGAGLRVAELPPCHNFPANHETYVGIRGMIEPLTAVHYHHLFGQDGAHALRQRLNLSDICGAWLDQRLPLAA